VLVKEPSVIENLIGGIHIRQNGYNLSGAKSAYLIIVVLAFLDTL
jgi:hypothetical protein